VIRGRPGVAVKAMMASRGRALPSRDGGGRFVAYPTISAPSWYVFCCGTYRIVGELHVAPKPATPPTAPRALPRAVAQPRRWRLKRTDVQNGIAFLALGDGLVLLARSAAAPLSARAFAAHQVATATPVDPRQAHTSRFRGRSWR